MYALYARQQNASRVLAIVVMSVCLSVTLRYCVITVQTKIKIFIVAAPRTVCEFFLALNANCRPSSPSADLLGSRMPAHTRASNRGTHLESGYFTDIDSFSIKTVADRHRHTVVITNTSDELFNGVNIDDIECSWTLKIWDFSVLKLFLCNFRLWRTF